MRQRSTTYYSETKQTSCSPGLSSRNALGATTGANHDAPHAASPEPARGDAAFSHNAPTAVAAPGATAVTAAGTFHPAVPAIFFVCALAFCMASMEPVSVILALVTGLTLSVRLRGMRATLKSALWQLPLIAIITLANPLFSASGQTELFRIGLRTVYAESLAYGACMGGMLVAMMLWFSNAAHILTSDKITALLGNRLPTLGLVISMTNRLVPQFVRRGNVITNVRNATTAAAGRSPIQTALRTSTTLMAWSMEDSLETATSMKARGWNSQTKRTTYSLQRFRTTDALALAVVLSLGAITAFSQLIVVGAFAFYPTLSGFTPWCFHVPEVVFLSIPLVLEAWEVFSWRS